VQTIGQEGHEDVRFDAMFELVMDGTQLEIVLEILEGGLDLDELDVELPQLSRVAITQIGAQQIAPLAAAGLAKLVAVEREAESRALGSGLDIDQTPGGTGFGARRAELHV